MGCPVPTPCAFLKEQSPFSITCPDEERWTRVCVPRVNKLIEPGDVDDDWGVLERKFPSVDFSNGYKIEKSTHNLEYGVLNKHGNT